MRFTLWLCLVGNVLCFSNRITADAASPNLRPLEQTLQAAGYKIYNPPRENWGPGFVFEGDVKDGRITNPVPICPNLYSDLDAPQSAAVVLADYNSSDSFSFKLALDLFTRLIGDKNAAKLGLASIESEQQVDVAWEDVREFSYTNMDQWLETGEPRPIARRCRLAIDDLKAKKRFDNRVFIIVRAVAPKFLTYDFSRAAKGRIEFSANLNRVAQASLEGKGEVKNSTEVEIRQRLYVGYAPPVSVKTWLPAGLVSGELVRIQGRTISTDLEIE